jgi:hypothetical protein
MRNRLAPTFLIAAVLVTGLWACRDSIDPLLPDPPWEPGSFVVNGTVRFLNVEGGCWAIHVSPQPYYEPVGLPDAFRHDGLQVRAAVKPRHDLGSYCMIGPIVEVVWIRRR